MFKATQKEISVEDIVRGSQEINRMLTSIKLLVPMLVGLVPESKLRKFELDKHQNPVLVTLSRVHKDGDYIEWGLFLYKNGEDTEIRSVRLAYKGETLYLYEKNAPGKIPPMGEVEFVYDCLQLFLNDMVNAFGLRSELAPLLKVVERVKK